MRVLSGVRRHWSLSLHGTQSRSAPPLLGQHTAEVLGGIGYDAAAIEALRTRGIVGVTRT